MMKDYLLYVAVSGVLILVLLVVIFAYRWLSNVTIYEDVIHPVEGVSCVKLATSDGVAVDCWKD